MNERQNEPSWERKFLGGLRWGESRWSSSRVTFPLAGLTVRPGVLELRTHLWIFSTRFWLTPNDVASLHPEQRLSGGVQIEQTKHRYMPYVCFMTLEPHAVLKAAAAGGFRVGT